MSNNLKKITTMEAAFKQIDARLERIEFLLSIMGKTVLNTKEAAQYMGIGLDQFQRLAAREHAIPYYKSGTAKQCVKYFKKEDIDTARMRCYYPTNDELEEQAATLDALQKTRH